MPIQPYSFVASRKELAWQFSPGKILASPYLIKALKNLDEPRYPIAAEIHPTSACNLCCNYCSFSERNRTPSSLTKDEIFQIVDWVKSVGTPSILFSGGGEPLCWPYWDWFFKKILEIEPKPMLSFATNAIDWADVIKPQYYEFLKIIQIGFHGFDENSFAKRTKKSVFEKFIHSVDIFFNSKTNSLQSTAKIIIDQNNFQHWQNYLALVLKWPFDVIVIKIAGIFEEKRMTSLSEKQIADLLDGLQSYNWPPRFTDYFSDLEEKWTVEYYHDIECHVISLGLYALFRSNGAVHLCVASADDPKSSIGSIRDTNIGHLWSMENHHEAISVLRRKLSSGNCRLMVCRHIRYNNLLQNFSPINSPSHGELSLL